MFAEQGKQDELEHLYSKVDRGAIRRAVQDEERMADNNAAYFNDNSYDDKQEYLGSFGGSETPPPVPAQNIRDVDDDDEEQGAGDEDPGYATIRSTISNNHDEGYSTVDETLQRGQKVSLMNH